MRKKEIDRILKEKDKAEAKSKTVSNITNLTS